MKTKYENGFTLYELLVTMLIVGIVLTIGIPNMSEFTANSRMATTANDLHSSFMLGRSEAARSKSFVTVCASADPLGVAATCDGAAFDSGWIIFLDLDGDLQRAGPGENLLRRHEAVDSQININVNGNATYFSFAPTGLGRGDVGVGPAFQTAVLCDSRGNVIAAGGNSAARYLVVTPIGRATVVRDKDIITARGGCP